MTPEQWKKVDRLFQAAIELRPEERKAFLDRECGGDETLRSEVEAMMASDENGLSFIEDPAFQMAANLLVHNGPELSEGHQLGHYKILGLLGAGGMGQVYLAEDNELGRKIAIKLLPEEFTQDEERLRRFRQEARAASALNHPNILTIHQISQTDGRYFIATEFIDGETLRQRLNRSRLTGTEVIDIATQVASALGAAHAAGIIHRDIKPENIMLRRDGYVKVLDFGLAKLTEQSESTGPAGVVKNADISSGLVMGTVKYMSPEQARGHDVDTRSDIFSFGVVLYEMIAGRAPFAGDSRQLVASIQKEDPQPLTNIPEQLQRIVIKALSKRREERYQSINELLAELKNLRSDSAITTDGLELTTGSISRASQTNSQAAALSSALSLEYIVSGIKSHKTGTTVVLAGLVFVGLGMTFGLKRFINRARTPVREMTVTRISDTEQSLLVAISPDGKYIAHVVGGAPQSLWLIEPEKKSNVQILNLPGVGYGGLTFSNDGNFLYYVGNGDLYQIPIPGGGEPRKILSNVSGAISFSPDGGRFAFVRNPDSERSDLMIANIDGTGEQVLTSRTKPQLIDASGPAWSKDGKLIAYVFASVAGNQQMGLEGFELATGEKKEITSQRWQTIEKLAWLSDGSGIVAPAGKTVSDPDQIWLIPYPTGEPQTVTRDLNDYYDLGVTADDAKMVTIHWDERNSIWIIPAGNPAAAKPLNASKHELFRVITFTPDGRILYPSNSGGNRNIWIMNGDGTDPKQLTNNSGNYLQPEASPDGRYIVVSSNRAGKGAFNIWRLDMDGSNPIQLTFGKGEIQPVCSPDGRWVVYADGGPETPPEAKTIWKIPLNGGQPDQLTTTPSNGPSISPDGTLIASWYKDNVQSPWKVALIPLQGGPPTKIIDAPRTGRYRVRWSPDGQSIAYIKTVDGVSNIWSQQISGGPPKQLTQFTTEFSEGFAWSRTGDLICSRSYAARDVVMISDFR